MGEALRLEWIQRNQFLQIEEEARHEGRTNSSAFAKTTCALIAVVIGLPTDNHRTPFHNIYENIFDLSVLNCLCLNYEEPKHLYGLGAQSLQLLSWQRNLSRTLKR
jgi:hypothetical protein